MSNFNGVLVQLRSERDRAEQEIQRLEEAIRILARLDGAGRGASRRGRGLARRVSPATRARMAAAQRARWAKRATARLSRPRTMSLAARRRIAAAQRARWARQRAAQKKAA
jgi:hypothetical protein